MTTIAVISGGRDHHVTHDERAVFFMLLERYGVTLVRHGGARGVDNYVDRVMGTRPHIAVEVWTPNWNFGKHMGFVRNGAMLAGEPWKGVIVPRNYVHQPADMLIAFPGGGGTANCMRQAFERRVPIYEVVKFVREGARA